MTSSSSNEMSNDDDESLPSPDAFDLAATDRDYLLPPLPLFMSNKALLIMERLSPCLPRRPFEGKLRAASA
jgi:hypothetical protein